MPAFKVRAMQNGEYNGVMYEQGKEFFLIDRKDPETGEVLQTAEEGFAEYKNKKYGNLGWMQRVGVAKITETPEQVLAREAAEAQKKADYALALGKVGGDPNLVPSADGTGLVSKIKGGMGYDPKGGSAGVNDGAGITLTSLMDNGYTQEEAQAILDKQVVSPSNGAAAQAAIPREGNPGPGPSKASAAAREAVGASQGSQEVI